LITAQVEVMDQPQLAGKPIAVTQFNKGGFVAVSYEARAACVRCGDGVGAGGRAALQHLKDMQAVSEEEARRRYVCCMALALCIGSALCSVQMYGRREAALRA
jgi:nucleotidyltransferase/DNA polymerase involved in DNA repair